MKCPECESSHIELVAESTGAILSNELQYYECQTCLCAFGSGGEIIEEGCTCPNGFGVNGRPACGRHTREEGQS